MIHRTSIFRIDAFQETDDGMLDIQCRCTRVGVLQYRDGDKTWRELRADSEVFAPESMESLKSVPITIGHSGKVTAKNWGLLAKGHVRDDVRRDGKYLLATVRISDAKTIAAIKNKDLTEVSCGYTCDADEDPGVHEDGEYQCVQRGIVYNHLALGPQNFGRAGNEVRLLMDGVDVGASLIGEDIHEDAKKNVLAQVKEQLKDDFPPESSGWIDDMDWSGPEDIPLASIDFSQASSWKAHHEPEKVAAFAETLDATDPVILVLPKGEDKYRVVDGHHRVLAYAKNSQDVKAYCAEVPKAEGPWDEMHNSQYHGNSRADGYRQDDIPPKFGPGMVMPSKALAAGEDPNTTGSVAADMVEQMDPQTKTKQKVKKVDKEKVGKTPAPGKKPIGLGDPSNIPGQELGFPELPHAQSTDIGDPYGMGNMSPPESQQGTMEASRAAKGGIGYPVPMADKTVTSEPEKTEKVKAEKMKVKADSVELHVDASALVTKELETVKGERDGMKIRCDAKDTEIAALKAEVAELKKFKQDSATVQPALVQARVALQFGAGAILGQDFKMDGLSDRDLMVAAVTKVQPAFKQDGKSDDYVRAVYDTVSERAAKSIDDQAKIASVVGREDSVQSRSDEAADKLRKRATEAWKGN